MFRGRLEEKETEQVIGIARRHNTELRYWQVGSTNLYVFKVPWNKQPSGNLDETIYDDLQQRGLRGFDLGYASDYEWEVYRQEILYWPEEERRRSRGNKP